MSPESYRSRLSKYKLPAVLTVLIGSAGCEMIGQNDLARAMCEDITQTGSLKTDIFPDSNNISEVRPLKENKKNDYKIKFYLDKIDFFEDNNIVILNKVLNEKTRIGKISSESEINERMAMANVEIEVRTGDKGASLCNGVHIGRGRIATASHCLDDDPLEKQNVRIIDNSGNVHEGKYAVAMSGVDAALIYTGNLGYPGEAQLGDVSKLEPNSSLTIFSRKWGAEKAYKTVYVGGYSSAQQKNCDLKKTRLGFLAYAQNSQPEKGHSGSGVFDPNTGKVVGIFTEFVLRPFENVQAIAGTRGQVFKELSKE